MNKHTSFFRRTPHIQSYDPVMTRNPPIAYDIIIIYDMLFIPVNYINELQNTRNYLIKNNLTDNNCLLHITRIKGTLRSTDKFDGNRCPLIVKLICYYILWKLISVDH